MPQNGQTDTDRRQKAESKSWARRKVEFPRLLPSEAEQEPPRIKAGCSVTERQGDWAGVTGILIGKGVGVPQGSPSLRLLL